MAIKRAGSQVSNNFKSSAQKNPLLLLLLPLPPKALSPPPNLRLPSAMGYDLPPGFRFHPTDEELIVYYLRNQALSQPCPAPIIPELNIYKYDPWELPGSPPSPIIIPPISTDLIDFEYISQSFRSMQGNQS